MNINLRRFKYNKIAEREVWSVRLASLFTALMGVINILSAVTPGLAERLILLEQLSPLMIRRGGHLTAALAGFALLVLANGLWRRKQLAWLLTLVVLALSVASHLIKGLDYEEAALAAVLGVWLVILGPRFHARSDQPTIRRGLGVLAMALGSTLVYGVTGFYLLDRHFSVNFGLFNAVRQTVVMFAQFYDPGLEPITGFGRYFAASIYVVGFGTLAYALISLISPVLVRRAATPAEKLHAQTIVQAHGRSALARFVLLPDKAYYFSPGGSVVGYAARRRAAIALGDPIGPAQDVSAAIAGFKQFCSRNDWYPVFFQTLPDYLPEYKAAGFDSICIGHEGVVDLTAFSISGRSNKNFRSAVNQLTKQGYRAQFYNPPLPTAVFAELQAISDEWLTMMHGREKRFSLGWFEADYLNSTPVAVIHAPDGSITAFANLVTEYRLNEVGVDLMRRRHEIEPGTMDFLFISLFEWAKAQGFSTFNLGLSALSGVGENPQDPATERTLHFVYEYVNQFYNFKGVHGFKEKFHPVWQPRYIIYPGLVSLLPASATLTRISSGEDFVFDYLRGLFPRPH